MIVKVQVHVPAPGTTAVSNLLAVAGLGGIVAAVGLLAGLAWALLAAGGILVALAGVAATYAGQEQSGQPLRPVTRPRPAPATLPLRQSSPDGA